MLKIRYPAAVAALLVNGGVLAALVYLANHPIVPPIEKVLEVALITAPAVVAPEPPRPEPPRKPEPLPVVAKPPPKVPPKVQPKTVPAPAPSPAPAPVVALAPAASESSTNTIAAEPAPPTPTVVAKVAEPAPAPAPIKEPPKVDASWSGNERPSYPALARRMHIEGRTVLDVHVAADGTVIELKLKRSSGSNLLDDAAIEAIKKWRFTPATLGGKPVAEWYYNWPTVFSLNE